MFHRQVIEKKTIFNKHQNTADVLHYQAVAHMCRAYKKNSKYEYLLFFVTYNDPGP